VVALPEMEKAEEPIGRIHPVIIREEGMALVGSGQE